MLFLHLHRPSDATMQAIAQQSLFPPLQTLHIHTSGTHWLRIIELCADTLVNLAIEDGHSDVNRVPSRKLQNLIKLPRLQRLAYFGRTNPFTFDFTLLSFKTPALKSYKEVNPQKYSPMHKDVSSVTCLDISHEIYMGEPVGIKFTKLQSLLHLRLETPHNSDHGIAKALEKSPETCPRLSIVDFLAHNGTFQILKAAEVRLVMQSRVDRNGKTGNFQLFSSEKDYLKASTMTNDYACFSFCECNSPGHPQQDLYHEGCS